MALSSLILAALVPYGPAPTPPPTSPAPVEDDKPDEKWHGFFDAGGTYTDGNTKIRSVSAATEAIKELTDDRFTLRGFWNYSKNDGDTTDENAGASGKWDHFLNEKLYYNVFVGVENDKQANIDLRYYLGAGLGYQFRDDEKLKLNGEAGLGWYNEKLSPGEDKSYLAARVAYSLDYAISETTLFQQRGAAFPSLEEAEDFYSKLDSKLSFMIKENLSAFVQHILDYDNTPADDADRVDNRVTVGLRWTF